MEAPALERFEAEIAETDAKPHSPNEVGIISTATTNAFFDTGRNLYWICNQRGGWIALNETQFKRVLRQRGISPKVPEGSTYRPWTSV